MTIPAILNPTNVVVRNVIPLAYDPPLDAHGDITGPYATCTVHFNPTILTATARVLAETIPHEVFHCYQAYMASTLLADAKIPDWINEGGAEWVGATLSGNADAPGDLMSGRDGGSWVHCLNHPERPLYGLSYDALCFFSEMDEQGRSPWDHFWALSTEYGVSGNQGAFVGASGGEPFLDDWARSVVRAPSLGAAWDLTGPGILTDVPTPKTLLVGNNDGAADAVGIAANLIYDVTLTADVVSLTTPLHSVLHTVAAGGLEMVSPQGFFCTFNGACDCPMGSEREGQTIPTLPMDEYYLTMGGGLNGAAMDVEGLRLEDYCNTPLVDPCMQGSWTVQSVDLPSDSGACTYPQPFGATFSFAKSGAAAETFSGNTITCTEGSDVGLTMLNGVATASVTSMHGVMTIASSDSSGLMVTSTFDGVDVSAAFGSLFASSTAMTGNVVVSYGCGGNQLTLTTSNPTITYHLSR